MSSAGDEASFSIFADHYLNSFRDCLVEVRHNYTYTISFGIENLLKISISFLQSMSRLEIRYFFAFLRVEQRLTFLAFSYVSGLTPTFIFSVNFGCLDRRTRKVESSTEKELYSEIGCKWRLSLLNSNLEQNDTHIECANFQRRHRFEALQIFKFNWNMKERQIKLLSNNDVVDYIENSGKYR